MGNMGGHLHELCFGKPLQIFRLFFVAIIFVVVTVTAQAEEYSIVKDKKETGYDDSESFMEWHGYLNFEFDDKEGTNSNFDNHEFYLNVSATMSSRVKVTAEFEYEHTPEKIIAPIQAFADYKVFDNDALYVRGGLWYIPMGLPPSENLRGNGNKMIRQVAVIHDIEYENWAEAGLDFWGATAIGENTELAYDVYFGNGVQGIKTGDSWFQSTETLQDHSEDNNNNKLSGIHLALNFKNILGGSLGIGTSYSTQAYTEEAGKDLDQTHTGFDLRYHHTSLAFGVQAEYLSRDGDDLTTLVNPNISVEAKGWYVQVYKRFLEKAGPRMNYLELVFQTDKIDLNLNTDTNNDKTTNAIGLIYSPEPYVQIKIEYDWVKENSGDSIDNNVFWAAAVFQF